MPRMISGYVSGPRGGDQLIACDPTGLNTLTIPLRAGQGRLQPGTFLTWDGHRSLAPSQINGVLSLDIDSTSGRTGMLLPSTPKADSGGPDLYCES